MVTRTGAAEDGEPALFDHSLSVNNNWIVATVPAHLGFIAEQLKLLRDWEPRISDEHLTEGAQALVDAALAIYGTIQRTEKLWSDNLASGAWRWDDGHDRGVAHLYRDWHRTAGEIITHLDALEPLNVAVRNADMPRECFGKVDALVDIGLDRVFQQPAPPQSGTSLWEARDGLPR
jgi:hypothetical protein